MADLLEFFLVPSPRLGTIDDIRPERITSGLNDWIPLSKEVLALRRAWAEKGHPAPQNTDISEDHHQLRPFGAQHCPALQELNQVGWLLKWPADAVLRRQSNREWQIQGATELYKFHTMSSFVEAGLSEAISVDLGWVVITPPGFSTLVKNVPNNLSGHKQGIVFAEGIVRTDQAMLSLQVHAFLEPTAPKEIVIRRGEPMCLLMPFRREPLSAVVVEDADTVAEVGRHVERDDATTRTAPGTYKALYLEDENPSPLYPKLRERFGKK